jgi:predicted nucleic acid-binding protein
VSDFLADGNLLVALTVQGHIHHETALAWFDRAEPDLATCPMTDAYLVALARHHGGQVATLDRGLVALHGEAVHLLDR